MVAAAQASKHTHQPTHLAEHDKALLDHTLEIILVKPPAEDTHTHPQSPVLSAASIALPCLSHTHVVHHVSTHTPCTEQTVWLDICWQRVLQGSLATTTDEMRGAVPNTQSVSCCRGCSRINLPVQTQQLGTQWCCTSSGACQAHITPGRA